MASNFKKLHKITHDILEQCQICIKWTEDVLKMPCDDLPSVFESGENLIRLIEILIPGENKPEPFPAEHYQLEIRNRKIREIAARFAISRKVKMGIIFNCVSDYTFAMDFSSGGGCISALLDLLEAVAFRANVNLERYYVKGAKPTSLFLPNDPRNLGLPVKEKTITLFPIGSTGVGKSTFINAWLKEDWCEAGSSAKSVTQEIKFYVKNSDVVEKKKYQIVWHRASYDVPGLNDSERKDPENIRKIGQRLIQDKPELTVIALLIQKGSPRFDANIQRMLRVLYSLVHDANLWNHLCVIVTRSVFNSEKQRDREINDYLEGPESFRNELIAFIKKLTRWEGGDDPRIPFFFVDNDQGFKEDEGDFPVFSRKQMNSFDEWARGHDSFVPKEFDLQYMHKETVALPPEFIRGEELEPITVKVPGKPVIRKVKKMIPHKVLKMKKVNAIHWEEYWEENGRPWDRLDKWTIGIARLFRDNRVKKHRPVEIEKEVPYEESTFEIIEVDVPSGKFEDPQVQIVNYCRIDQEVVKKYQIGWDYEAPSLDPKYAVKIPNTETIEVVKRTKVILEPDGLTEKHTFHLHNNRILFMCPSPDGSSIITAAPQDSFQIWRLFPGRNSSFSDCFIKIR